MQFFVSHDNLHVIKLTFEVKVIQMFIQIFHVKNTFTVSVCGLPDKRGYLIKMGCSQGGFYQSHCLKGDCLFLLADVIFQTNSQEKSNSFQKQIHCFQQFLFIS